MEEFTMAHQSKRDYLRSMYSRYASAHRQAKAAMLEEFCRVRGYHRKYAIWLLNRPLPEQPGTRAFTPLGRPRTARRPLGSSQQFGRPPASCARND